jgi:protein-disulfide isomerase
MPNGRRTPTVLKLTAAAMLLAAVAFAETPQQAVKRFARAYFSYAPGSAVEVTPFDKTYSGPYLAFTAIRTCIKPDVKDQLGMLVDPVANTVAVGMLFPVQPSGPAVTADMLPELTEKLLAQRLTEFFGARVKIPWPSAPFKLGAVIPLAAMVSTGYGAISMPVALGVDARHLVVGGTWPLDRDPREVRRELLTNADVQWDPVHQSASVQIVEFSDFQCPACKRGWGSVKPLLEKAGARVRHGLVNFPLVAAHPWAFKAAVAGECVGSLWPAKLLPLKEEFYRLQETMTLESVDPAVWGFLAQHSLDENRFRACYLKDPSIEIVLRQLDLGYRLGVTGTPTYFANGEPLPWGETEWFEKRLDAIIAAGKPEVAAEIVVSPPTPTPSPAAPGAPSPKPSAGAGAPTPAPH